MKNSVDHSLIILLVQILDDPCLQCLLNAIYLSEKDKC